MSDYIPSTMAVAYTLSGVDPESHSIVKSKHQSQNRNERNSSAEIPSIDDDNKHIWFMFDLGAMFLAYN